MNTEVRVGSAVVYVDAVGKPTNAIVTAVWSPTCVNVVTVSDDQNKQDTYGRQIERFTSVLHKSSQPAHGWYWMNPGEVQNPIQKPQES